MENFPLNHWVLYCIVQFTIVQSPLECLIFFPWLFKPVGMEYEFSLLVDYLSFFFKGADS